MRLFPTVLLLLFVSVASLSAKAAEIGSCKLVEDLFPDGYYQVEYYRELSKAERIPYISGYFDGFMSTVPLGVPLECMRAFGECLHGKTNEQLTAIVDKFIEANPEQWHLPMTMVAFNSLGKFCGVPGLAG